jgi:SAM-dependent methyltransferase
MDHSCLICRRTDIAPLYRGLLRCRNCQYIFADLNLTDDDFVGLYDQSLFKEGEFFDYAADRKHFAKNFRLRYKVLRRYLNPTRHTRLLEIGSAYGGFLDVVRSDFQELLGMDLTDEGVRYTRAQLGLAAVRGDFLQHDFDAQEFDVVCMWDTIEHVRRPDLYLQRISELTRPGALLALTTGDIGSFVARLRGPKWRLIIPPIHAHYFSRATIARLLDTYGFDIVYDRYTGFYRSASQVAYIILALRHKRPALFRRLEQLGVLNWGFYLNIYDIMYVIARKR